MRRPRLTALRNELAHALRVIETRNARIAALEARIVELQAPQVAKAGAA
jgi:hypothetical protein